MRDIWPRQWGRGGCVGADGRQATHSTHPPAQRKIPPPPTLSLSLSLPSPSNLQHAPFMHHTAEDAVTFVLFSRPGCRHAPPPPFLPAPRPSVRPPPPTCPQVGKGKGKGRAGATPPGLRQADDGRLPPPACRRGGGGVRARTTLPPSAPLTRFEDFILLAKFGEFCSDGSDVGVSRITRAGRDQLVVCKLANM